MTSLRLLRLAAPALAVLAVPLLDCATLSPLAADTCGNGVVDANEDCDSFPAACGRPGTGAGACRIACGGSQPPCPDGWGCAVEGFCRQPSGAFGPPGTPGSTGTATMLVGDFDGDGRKDVVGVSTRGAGGTAKVRVAYYGDDAALEKVLPLASPVSSLSVRDVDGDGRDDLFAVRAGADILRGRPDRTFLPILFPTLKAPNVGHPVLVHATDAFLPNGSTVATFILQDVGGAMRLNTSEPGFSLEIPEPYASLAGPPVWAEGVKRAALGSACGEIYIPLNGAGGSRVLVAELCRAVLGAPRQPPQTRWVMEPPTYVNAPAKIVGKVHVADVDGDGHADLVVGAETGAYWSKQTPVTGAFSQMAPLKDEEDGDIIDEPPLAVVDLNGDGLADFVLPEAILVTVGARFNRPDADAGAPERNYEPVAIRARRWTVAKAGRLDGDDRTDLVLASADAPDLDVFLGGPNGVLTQFTVPTTGYVSDLEIDDFDGDKLGDVALMQVRGGRSELGIAYGNAAGAPSAPIIAGELDGVFALEALRENGAAGQNTLSVWLRTADGGASGASVALLLGSGEREPQAPLIFTDAASKRPLQPPPGPNRDALSRTWLPITSVLAPIADASRPDIVSFCLGYTYERRSGNPLPAHPVGLWAAPATGPLAFDPPTELQPIEDASAEDVLATRAVAGDLDKAGTSPKHEIVLIRRSRTGQATLFIYRGEGLPKPFPLSGVDIDVSTALDLLDVDGDGLLDLVVYTGSEASRQTFIGYNDGAGAFALPLAPLAVPDDPAHPGERARSLAVVTVAGASPTGEGAKRRELAVLTGSRLLLMRQLPGRTFETRDITAASGLAGMAEATGLAVGDFDGDGVEDVAIAEGGSVRILRQIPRLR
jgi:hypothetical protein